MSSLFGLGLVLEYTDNASAGLLGTQRIFNQTRASAQELTTAVNANAQAVGALAGAGLGLTMFGAGMMGLGKKVLAPLQAGYNAAKEFQTEMTMVGVVTGETGAELDKLKRIAIDVGIETAFSATEAAKALYQLKSAGLSTEASVASLKDTLNLVMMSGGEISLEEGATLMVQTMNKFNLASSEAGRIADMWGELSKDTMFKMNEFSAFANSLGSAPATLNRPMEELLAMGGMLRNIGQEAAQSGATVQGFGRKLLMLSAQIDRGASGSKEGFKAKAMNLIGLDNDTIWDAEGNMRSMQAIFSDLIKTTADLTQEQKAVAFQTVFGDQAKNMITAVELGTKAYMQFDKATGKYIVAPSKEGKKTLDELVASLGSVDGMAKSASDAFLATSAGINQLWSGSVETMGILLGQQIQPVIDFVVSNLTKILNVFLYFAEEHPMLVRVLGWGLGLAGLLLIVGGMTSVLIGLLMMVGAGFLAASGQAVKFAIAQGLVTDATLAANGGLLTGSMLLKVYGGQFKTFAGSITSKVVPALRGLMFTLLRLFAVVGLLYLVWKTDFLHIRTIVTNFGDNVKNTFGRAKEILGMNCESMMKSVRELEGTGSTWDRMTVWLVKAGVLWQALCESWNDYTISDETLNKLRELGILANMEHFWDLKMRFEALWKGIKYGWEEVTRVVTDNVNFCIGKVKQFGEWINSLKYNITGVAPAVGGVATEANRLELDKWIEFGETLGIIAGILVTVKIASILWEVGVALAYVAWAAGALGVVLLTTPLGWVIMLLAAIIVLGYLLVKNWDYIKQAFVDLKDFIYGEWCWLWGAVTDWFNTKMELINAKIQVVKDWFMLLWNDPKAAALEFFNWLAGKFSWVTSTIASVRGWFAGADTAAGEGQPVPEEPQLQYPMASGGFVKSQGTAMLHAGEVVVNDNLTQRLSSFLGATPGSTSGVTATQGAQDNRIIIEAGAVQITSTGNVEYDAGKFVEEIEKKLARRQQLRNMAAYQPIGVM